MLTRSRLIRRLAPALAAVTLGCSAATAAEVSAVDAVAAALGCQPSAASAPGAARAAATCTVKGDRIHIMEFSSVDAAQSVIGNPKKTFGRRATHFTWYGTVLVATPAGSKASAAAEAAAG